MKALVNVMVAMFCFFNLFDFFKRSRKVLQSCILVTCALLSARTDFHSVGQ